MNESLISELLVMLRHIAPDIDPDPAAVDPRRPMVDQLDLDSMDYQNFLAAISARYQIQIPEPDVARLQTLDDVATYVTEHREHRASRSIS
jgi:acyl carrier protein